MISGRVPALLPYRVERFKGRTDYQRLILADHEASEPTNKA